jgi:tetratricopeptide (TPR) repeat protein
MGDSSAGIHARITRRMPPNGDQASDGSIKLRAAFASSTGGRASVAAVQIEALLATLDAATEPSERAEILVDIARKLRDDLGDAGQAVDALLEAWTADPTLEIILDVLEPLVTAERRWAEVLEATRALASAERVTPRAVAYAEAMVRWLTRDVPDPELARQWLERIRALDSTHWQLHMLQAAMSREHGDLKRELDELDLAVLSARRADDRARIHLRMAARFADEKDRSWSLAGAKKHFAAAHKLFPRMIEPLRGLEQTALREGDKVSLADVLRKQAEADVDDAERITILLWLAKIEEEDFRKPELAARTLERVIALAPGHAVAVEALERTYGASRAWPELAAVLERAVTSTADPQLRVARLQRLSAVLETKLGDARAAIETYERLQKSMPDDETVLTELARLNEKLGEVRAAVHYRERLAELAPAPSVRARMHVIAGQLLVPLDAGSARQHFERAVAADASNQAAWNALLWDARADNDAARTERYLEERAWKTETPRARAAAFVELADARAKRGDAAAARRAYEEAASSDPTNETAAVKLVTALVEEGRYAEAEPLCEVAVSAAERDKDYDRIVTVRWAQARAATALGKPGRALLATLAAYELRSDSVEAKEALVAAAVPMRADPAVLDAREALVAIADKPDGLSVEARAALADVLVLTGDADRAAVLYEDVLSEAPDHDRALAGLAQHHTAAGNPTAALSLKRQLALAVVDPEARFAELVSVAEQLAGRAGNDELAAEVYEEARLLRPRHLPILHKLLGLYPKLGKWASLFDVLRSIAESDSDPARKAKTLYTMAQLAQDELADRGASLSLFEQALDVDPSQLVAFENIVRILTEDRDWLGLEQMYKRMIVRALAGGAREVGLQHALYKQVGLVYRDRLGDPQKAISAFQAAVHLEPGDEQGQTILRELLSHTGQSHGAVAVTLERILREPLEPGPYPALFELLVAQGERDRALCVASAMRFLGIAHAGAIGLRASYPHPPIEAVVLDLGREGYRELLHQELDPALTEIFEVVAPAVVDIVLSRISLRDRLSHPGSALSEHDWLAKAAARAGAILGAPSPRVFQRAGPGPALVAAATKPASLLAHPPALGGIAPDAVAFLIGKRVFEISPPLLARALCPSLTELKALAQSAARIATDQTEPGDLPLKQRLDRQDIARVAAAVHDAMSKSGKLDVLRWSQRADVSASRAGLLLAGDLEAARAAIAFEAQAPSDLSPREKMKELVGWFLGDASAAMRKRLGVAR